MSIKDELQLAQLLLRDGDNRPQQFCSDLKIDGDTKTFVVGRSDTGEYYRHTVKTEFVKPVEDGSGGFVPGEFEPVE